MTNYNFRAASVALLSLAIGCDPAPSDAPEPNPAPAQATPDAATSAPSTAPQATWIVYTVPG